MMVLLCVKPDKKRLHATRSRFGRSVVVSDVILVSLVLSTSLPIARFDVTYVTSDVSDVVGVPWSARNNEEMGVEHGHAQMSRILWFAVELSSAFRP